MTIASIIENTIERTGEIEEICGIEHSFNSVLAEQDVYKRQEEIRKRLETASVVGADDTGATVGKHLHWNWIFQNDLLTYVFQSESRGQKAIDSKFPKGQMCIRDST